MVLPVILILLVAFLAMQSAVTAEIKLKGALDRTAAELALLSPLAQVIEPILSDGSLSESENEPVLVGQLEDLVRTIIPDFSLEDLAADFMLDATSTAALGQVLQQRVAYWLQTMEDGQSARSGSAASSWERQLQDSRIYLDWRLEQRQLWLCLSYRLSTPLGQSDRQIRSIVPLWLGDFAAIKPGESEAADGSVWLLDNFTRGQIIRRAMGGDLPYDFPVIARFSGGEATMIKSLDLTAPGYQQIDALLGQVGSYLENLAGFTGAVYERDGHVIRITTDEIISRRLILVVPANASQAWLADAWSVLGNRARSMGIVLQIVPYGDSLRYVEQTG